MTRWMITDGPPETDVDRVRKHPLPHDLAFYLDYGAEIPIWLGSGMLPAAWLPVSDELRRQLVAYQLAYENLGYDDPWPLAFLKEGHRLIAASNAELEPKGHRVIGRFEFERGPEHL